MEVKVAQLCPTLWDPMDYRVHGILQARILEGVAFPSSGDLLQYFKLVQAIKKFPFSNEAFGLVASVTPDSLRPHGL